MVQQISLQQLDITLEKRAIFPVMGINIKLDFYLKLGLVQSVAFIWGIVDNYRWANHGHGTYKKSNKFEHF